MIAMALDTSVLSPFARTGRLDLLERVLAEYAVVTTPEVLGELRDGLDAHPELIHAIRLPWLGEVAIDHLGPIFAAYANRLGITRDRNIGEVTVLTWAEANRAIAVLDDEKGRTIGKERGVQIKGSMWLLSRGIRLGTLTLSQACRLVEDFRAIGKYLPCDGAGFERWAREAGLLDDMAP